MIGQRARRWVVELSVAWGVVRVRYRQVVESVSLLSQLWPLWQLLSHVPASSLPPELCCHEAGEALQLRTLAQDWLPYPPSLAELLQNSRPGRPAREDRQTDAASVGDIEPWDHHHPPPPSSFLSSPQPSPFWISPYVFQYKTV